MNFENKAELVQNDTTISTENKSSTERCVVTGIYGLKNKSNEKWYVGQSNDIYSRWETAYKKLRCRGQRKIYNALILYGYDNFDKVILERCTANELNGRELYWSTRLDSINNGYNIRQCGGSHGKLSDETRKRLCVARRRRPAASIKTRLKMSNSQTGRKHSTETRMKMSKPKSAEAKVNMGKYWIGRKHSEESRQKMRESHIGKSISDETREKMRTSAMGKRHSDETREKIRLSWIRRRAINQK